jgi:hypothetical protein
LFPSRPDRRRARGPRDEQGENAKRPATDLSASGVNRCAGGTRRKSKSYPGDDGIHWSSPSPALLKGVYAPTVLKDGDTYRLWYTDVSKSPWLIRYAESRDGRSWSVESEAVLKVDQEWELSRLFYPTVRKVDDVLLMWYGSYWKGQGSQKTALGFAVSRDGRHWTKSRQNPVIRPDPKRPWESHYVTSQSLLRQDDGSWRFWYASRTKPPFVHKYFAIGTAIWSGRPVSRPD